MAQIAFQLIAGYALSRIAAGLTKGDPDSPLVDEKPTSFSTRGSFIPIVQGARRIGPQIGWVGNRTVVTESGGSGGKGGGVDNSSNQRVYSEDAWHVLCVGPASGLIKIWANGERLKINGSKNPIYAISSPSGTTITITGADFEGEATIYWGEREQPVNYFLSDEDRVGIPSSWPFICYIVWDQARLGGFAQWPALEYEIEVPPYLSTNYLTTTTEWVENSLGAVEAEQPDIGYVLNSAISGEPWIRIFDDGARAAAITTGGYVKLTGQPNKETNRTYQVASAVYDAGDGMYDPNLGSFVQFGADDDATNWTQDAFINSVNATSSPPSFPPPWQTGDAAYAVTSGSTARGKITYEVLTPDDALSDGRNRIECWVYHPLASGERWFQLGFEAEDGPAAPTDDHVHIVNFTLKTTGQASIVNSNGAIGEVVEVNAITGWWRLRVTYDGGTGEDPSTGLWDRVLRIKTEKSLTTYIYFDTHGGWVFENDGQLVLGVTTITINEPMTDVFGWVGQVQAYGEGYGSYRGTNVIHSLVQFLFRPHPHGAALEFNDWSQASLNTAAEFFAEGGTEPYRCSILAQGGEDYRAIVANILLDIGVMWSWDATIGKYVLEIIRKPLTSKNIPEKALLPPLSEVDSLQSTMATDRVIFGFPDQAIDYRDNGVPAKDHSLSHQRGRSQRSDVVQLYTVADFNQAKKVAPRRGQEELAPPTSFKHYTNRSVRALRPGLAVDVDGFNPIQRIMSQRWDTNSGRMEINTLADTYGVQADEIVQGFGPPPDNESTGPEDVTTLAFELPALLSADRHVQMFFLRIREDATSEAAEFYVSHDGLSYRSLGRQTGVASGGTLAEAVPSTTTRVIETGYTFDIQGPDLSRATSIQADVDWRAGKQWALVGNVNDGWEIWYVRAVTIVSTTQARMDGIIRSPLGVAETHDIIDSIGGLYPAITVPVGQTMSEQAYTNQKPRAGLPSHSIGDQVFLFQPADVPVFSDTAFQPNTFAYFKAQPIGDITRSLAFVPPANYAIVGRAYKPIQISGLRLENLTRGYATGSNVNIRWDITRNFAKRERSGGGLMIGSETANQQLSVEGTFTLKIYTKTDTLVRTESLEAPRYDYSNANLLSDLGSEDDFIVGVTYSRRGYDTEELKLYISAV